MLLFGGASGPFLPPLSHRHCYEQVTVGSSRRQGRISYRVGNSREAVVGANSAAAGVGMAIGLGGGLLAACLRTDLPVIVDIQAGKQMVT